jgi:predicted phosphoribosyltransferase
MLQEAGLATLLIDLLEEEESDDRAKVFDIELLAGRLQSAADWLAAQPTTRNLRLGYFGASTGAAAALVAAARRPEQVAAVVSRGGRPDLAWDDLPAVQAPTLLIVGGADEEVVELNQQALQRLQCPKELAVVPGATHLFPEPGALEEVARLAADWFGRYLGQAVPVDDSESEVTMFRDREDAGRRLARRLKGRALRDPLVLAIPRGGVVLGAILAEELGAELDVVLSRKLRAPMQPECAIGAVSEGGHVFLNHHSTKFLGQIEDYLEEERQFQLAEIARRKRLIRAVRPHAAIAGRSVIVTDDGIATGSTMIAALQALKAQGPHEVIVAVPVASPDRLAEVARWCDDVVCLLQPEEFWAIGQFYQDFTQVEDAEVVELLRKFGTPAGRSAAGVR